MKTAPRGVSVPRPHTSYPLGHDRASPRQEKPRQRFFGAWDWPEWTDRRVPDPIEPVEPTEPVEPPEPEKVHPGAAMRAAAEERIARQKGGLR